VCMAEHAHAYSTMYAMMMKANKIHTEISNQRCSL
jgi:hypothetical protein